MQYLAQPLLNTLLLAVAALFIDFVIGIFIGVISAIRPNSKLDHSLTLGIALHLLHAGLLAGADARAALLGEADWPAGRGHALAG